MASACILKSFESNQFLRGVVTANYTLYLENGASRVVVYRMKGDKWWGICCFSSIKMSLTVFAYYRLSAVTLFNHHQQKSPKLIDNKKNHSIWTSNGEMLQASELCRLSISIKSQAQKLSQSECQPCLALKSSLIGIKVSTLSNLPKILRVFEIQLGSVVTYWVQRNLSPTASLRFYANSFWTKWKEKRPTRGLVRRWYSRYACRQRVLGGGQHRAATF